MLQNNHLSVSPPEIGQFNNGNLQFDGTVKDLRNINRSDALLNLLKDRQNSESLFKNYTNCETNNKLAKFGNELSHLKLNIAKLYSISKELKSINNELRNENLSDSEWFQKQQSCERLKKNIKSCHLEISPDALKAFKRVISNQKRGRNRKKKQNKNRHLKKNALNERRNALTLKINNWIEEKQNEIHKEKEEKALRKDADIILSDVRTKRSDAKKFLIILQELENLRKVKVTMANMRVGITSFEADEVFTNIIVKLMMQWKTLDKEYSLEEKGLRLMIKVNTKKQMLKHTSNVHRNWQITIFGDKGDITLQKTFKGMLMRRMIWDKFASNIEGSTIPIGWAVPSNPSSLIWKKYKKNLGPCKYNSIC